VGNAGRCDLELIAQFRSRDGCGVNAQVEKKSSLRENLPVSDPSAGKVVVRFLGPDGNPADPETVDKVVKPDSEWQRLLTPEQYRITRGKGTEPAFCGGLLAGKEPGIYRCVGCTSRSRRRTSPSGPTAATEWNGSRFSAPSATRT